MEGWTNAVLCHYQTQHSHSVAEDCVAVGSDVNPRMKLGAWLASRLYEGDLASVVSRMRRLEFTAIALHSDWINASDRIRLETALKPLRNIREEQVAEGLVLYHLDRQATLRDESEGPSSRIIGPQAGLVSWSLRVDLAAPIDLDLGRVFLAVDGHAPVELLDGDGVVGSAFEDGVHVGRFEGWVSGSTQVRLYRVLDEKHVILWTGSIMPLDLDEDMVSFKTMDGRTATPFLRSLDTFSPEIRHQGGWIIGLGWLLSLLIILGLWVPVKTRVESDAA